MGENLFHKPTMVSRLPKFGARPAGGTSPMLNGSGQSTPSVEGKVPLQGKINGMVHVSSLPALKRKTGGGTASLPMPRSEQDLEEKLVAMTREVKNAPAIASQPRRLSPVPRGNPRGGRVQGTHSSKLKGSNGGPAPSRSSLRRLVPDPSLRQGLSRSSDSLKALSVDNMVRSQSFSHFKQLPSTSPLPVSHSLSFSKGQARCKPVSGRPSPGTKDPAAAAGLAPPSVLKKALLPGKPSVLSYKLTRPSMVKHPRPSSRQGSRDSMVTPLTSPDPPSDLGGTPEESPGPSEAEHISQCPTEFPEDMSLSSTSSLEHVDTSEEYLDDFDNLGDLNGLLQLLPPPREGLLQSQPHALVDNTPPSRQESTPSQTSLHSLLSDSVDWAEMGLTGGDNDFRLPNCHNDQALSPDVGYPHGSSLDLSPSDSSGGTYMWDEEGLEPLGVPAHPCGSYDSDINSMDILNNLDNLESCDLEEDDLMLDVDLPEDCSLHSDADRSSCTEGPGDPGLWGRPGQGHASDRESVFPELDIYSALGVDQPAGGCAPRCTSPSGIEAETLWDMAQDCSSVKAQLLHLKGLLQSEAEDTIQEALQSEVRSLEPNKESSAAFQVEALLREVQDLREELRSKEETILLLTQQMSASVQAGRCTCRRRDSGERRSSSDKATQTPWTRSAGVLPVPLLYPWQGLYQGTPQASVPHRQQTSNTTAFRPLDQRAPCPGSISWRSFFTRPRRTLLIPAVRWAHARESAPLPPRPECRHRCPFGTRALPTPPAS
ncbi:serine-rich coiled-coil domain-containing protein 2 isoform X2 [Brienomyrus brachyistius]|uniref:serine-rich coiled-coil domain-containing protein 2 isoform X2 n=1 Tax=Brienomyrus brachyistius TaxID=42636 RepID=UPI0020B27F2A|nr:serine-rich coiled-coil domain-containing protein 2 isoform X2 [Brienomyrus brachyistius]